MTHLNDSKDKEDRAKNYMDVRRVQIPHPAPFYTQKGESKK